MITVGEIYEYLDGWAPFDTAEAWDNVGLLAGSAGTEVTAAVTALDITPAVVDFAAARGAQLIVSHHPVIFTPLRRLETGTVPWRLAAAGMAAICAHTNLDRAGAGVNDWLAASLSLSAVTAEEAGLCRVGELPAAMEPGRFVSYVEERLNGRVRYRAGRRPVRTVGLCSGAGGDYLLPLWRKACPDALLTGELKHHEWLDLAACGATVVEAGHYHTEIPAARGLAARLSERFPSLLVTAAEEDCPYRTI